MYIPARFGGILWYLPPFTTTICKSSDVVPSLPRICLISDKARWVSCAFLLSAASIVLSRVSSEKGRSEGMPYTNWWFDIFSRYVPVDIFLILLDYTCLEEHIIVHRMAQKSKRIQKCPKGSVWFSDWKNFWNSFNYNTFTLRMCTLHSTVDVSLERLLWFDLDGRMWPVSVGGFLKYFCYMSFKKMVLKTWPCNSRYS